MGAHRGHLPWRPIALLVLLPAFAAAPAAARVAPYGPAPNPDSAATVVAPRDGTPPPVGGVFSLTEKARDRWGWSGAWRFPVGDPRDFTCPGRDGEPAFRLLRGIGGGETGTSRHDGADLGCGRAGVPVRAAAGGLVLAADRAGANSGYGLYVVLGHRLPEGGVVYSIYAHLAEGSIVVRPGQTVAAGARLGRVGRTGRATTPHLHFEVRRAMADGLRWEHERAEDPIGFVTSRCAPPVSPDTLGRYLEWAGYAGLIEGATDPAAPLGREHWWRMLAVAARHDLVALPVEPAALAESLVAMGVLPESPRPSPSRPLEWSDIARDLERIRELGLRLPARPLADRGHRAVCEEWFGVREPARALRHDAKLVRERPTVARAVLAVADLAPAYEPPARRPKKKAGARKAVAHPDSSAAATPAPDPRPGRAAGSP